MNIGIILSDYVFISDFYREILSTRTAFLLQDTFLEEMKDNLAFAFKFQLASKPNKKSSQSQTESFDTN